MSKKDQDAELVKAQVSRMLKAHQVWLQEHFPNARIWEILSANTRIFDRILQMAFPVFAAGMTDQIALIALGSYGREEVCPHSDLDLLILYQDLSLRQLEDFSNRLLSLLWDQKIQVGHSIRTIEQSLKLSEKDYSVLTSLLDARLVAGSEALFRQMKSRFEKVISEHTKDYFQSKLEERRARRQKFREEIWLTEPYLMEGTGGLRDWHLLKWFSLVCLNLDPQQGLKKLKIADPEGWRNLRGALGKLFRVRIGLHLLAGEKMDQLRIEYQKPLAKMLELKSRSHRLIEDCLLDYFFSGAELIARFLDQMVSELKIQLGLDRDKAPPPLTSTEAGFKTIDRSNFLAIFQPEIKTSELIQKMRQAGLLRKILPELDSAFSLGQRDGYHLFTVGWHSVRCLERIEQLSQEPEFGDDPELNWQILKLAGLSHDLGKSSGTDHLKAGAELARRLARRFGLGAEGELLKFLVSEHMLLNYYAQRRDFYEPKASRTLVQKIRDRARLKMLYLLTIADIQAVSETSWTSWKADLLKSLYHWLLAQIEKQETPSQLVQNRIAEIRKLWSGKAPEPNWISELEKLPTRYLLGTKPEKLIEQMNLVETRNAGEIVILLENQQKPRLMLTVICDDYPGLFSELAGVLSALNYNILSAEINTLKGNTVLDLFLIEDLVAAAGESWPPEMELRKERLKQTLKDAIEKKIRVPELVLKKRGLFKPSRNLEIRPEVSADQESSDDYTILEVQAQDQPGLLYKITRTIFEQGLDIHFAKISTRSEKVFDVFYLRDSRTRTKAPNETISQLIQSLILRLESKQESTIDKTL